MSNIKTSDFCIDCSGNDEVTKQLQELIDCLPNGGKLTITKGIYLTGPLFLKSNMEFHLEEGAILLGITKEDNYPIIATRVAGIEMPWYPAILNCIEAEHVTISGKGTIDGQGAYWWNKYWGEDMCGGMRKEYDQKGLRFACDYDCKRPRNVYVANSSNIILKEFRSYQAGFWNVHILYSKHIHVDGIKIDSASLNSPSTDGIDIDSCAHVLVENCVTSCNDDSICIKSGRDFDGMKVNRSAHDITIRNCVINSGFGVTIGSEVSGGVYDIYIQNMRYNGTDCGFRIKSSHARKGYIKNIFINGLHLKNVKYLFHFCLNWNPEYCLCELPEGYNGPIPLHWEKLLHHPFINEPDTLVQNIIVENVVSEFSDNQNISRAFHIEGFKNQPIKDIFFKNVTLNCLEYGVISYVENLRFENVNVSILGASVPENDYYDCR